MRLAAGMFVLLAAACSHPSFWMDDFKFTVGNALNSLDGRVLLPFREIETTTPDRYTKVRTQKNIMVPMRDGVKLATDVYTPDAEGPFPVIVIRVPYGKTDPYIYLPTIGKFWARKGYAMVAQDVRGKWGSEGVFEPFTHEVEDGYDTLDWISRQPWSNGNVGMMGESYYGYTTWAGAVGGHPSLKAVAPSTTSMEIYPTTFRNGALNFEAMAGWSIAMDHQTWQNALRLDMWHLPLSTLAESAGLSSRLYTETLAHPIRDEQWEVITLHKNYADVRVPALVFGGWYDNFLFGTITDWKKVRKSSADSAGRHQQWLLIGPWDHEYTTDRTGRIGRIEIGDASRHTRWEMLQEFFDYWLNGVDNGFAQRPRVQYFTIGPNEWRTADDWPLPGTRHVDFYFHSNGGAELEDEAGSLSTTPPSSEPPDRFVYDPSDPVALAHKVDFWSRAAYLQDRAGLVQRSDVLLYDSVPLDSDTELTGPITVTLFASSSAPDTDFTATLVDLHPDGYAHLVQEGIVRASYRESDTSPTPIEPGRIYEYKIDLWATSYVVKKGHRIRVEISSSNFDRFDRNPNTGEPFGTATHGVPATQRVFHTGEHPSRITLPIAP
jgi:putative CocE/NonD family hydrolase